jgi:hypothetical protein
MAASKTASFSFSASKISPKEVKFMTARANRADKKSDPVVMLNAHYNEETESISVFCSDGKLRECRINRLPSKEEAAKLWTTIQKMGKVKTEVQFVSAGGFSPDRWFYGVEKAV